MRTANSDRANTRRVCRDRGQVVTEYAVMLAMFFGAMLLMVMLLAIFTEYGWRMVSWACVDL